MTAPPRPTTSQWISTIRNLLIAGGLAPSDTDPRFHQQMVYAVASETLQRFESALGRRVHWRKLAHAPDIDAGAAGRWPRNVSTCFRTRCARPMRSTIPRCMASCSAISRPAAPIPGAICPARPSSPACRTTSSRMRRRMRSSTASANISWSRPISTCRRSTRRSPTLRPCLPTSRTGTCCSIRCARPAAGCSICSSIPMCRSTSPPMPPAIQAQIAAANPLIGLAQQFGEASGMRVGAAQRARHAAELQRHQDQDRAA